MDLQGVIGLVLFGVGVFLQFIVALALISLLNPGQHPVMMLLLVAGLSVYLVPRISSAASVNGGLCGSDAPPSCPGFAWISVFT